MNEIELTNEVNSLIEEVNKTHRYSMSRIYSLYNQVFGKDERPQSCASCLIRKVRELRSWVESRSKTVEEAKSQEKKKTTRKPKKE